MVLNTRTLVRDPALDVMNVGNRISRLLAEALSAFEWAGRDSVRAAWVPPVDVLEQDDAIRIVAELPGVRPEDVQLSVEGNVLTIHGQKREPAAEPAERVHRSERLYGEFERTFTLPASVDAAKITAAYDAGVLTVTLPKAEHARPRQIPIEATPARRLSGPERGGPSPGPPPTPRWPRRPSARYLLPPCRIPSFRTSRCSITR